MQRNLWIVMAVALMFYSNSAAVAQQAKQTIKASCQTEATKWNGERDACNSGWQELNAPEGHVINDRNIVRHESFNGSRNRCEEEFLEPTELVPHSGLTYPRKFLLRAHAYSHAGAAGGAGHSDCTRIVTFVKYK